MYWLQACITAFVVGSAPLHASTAPLSGLDTDWKRVGPVTWHRQIGGLGGSADIFIFIRNGAKWYKVLTPCGGDRFRQLTWRAGARIAEEVACDGTVGEDDTTEAWEDTAGESPFEMDRLLRQMPQRPRQWDWSRT